MNYARILVPFDFSEHSQHAFQVARALTSRLHAELHVVYVAHASSNRADEQKTFSAFLEQAGKTDGTYATPHCHLLSGNVHDEILGYASQCQADLIIMGTHGRTGIASLTLGSIAQRILKQASCPVLLVKATSAADRVEQAAVSEAKPALEVYESPAIELLDRAIRLRATDVHIDPSEGSEYQVRLRIDGAVVPYCKLDAMLSEQLIHQYGVLAKLDLTAPFRPHEGRLHLPPSLAGTEARITTSPVAGGSALAIRLASRENVFLPLDRLGFSPQSLERVRHMLRSYEGLVLVTGPTGSGKTTTVYSMLETLHAHHRNLVSVEDPVEYSVPFVRQIQVDERHGLTMAQGLKTLLRMDPDVVFVGEIREAESAEIALRAASSGRFVLSTLHARDSASTITALRDLNSTNHSIAGNVSGIINQRLLRKLCPDCRRARSLSSEVEAVFAENGMESPREIFEAVGCPNCRKTGYLGRNGVLEVVSCKGEVAAAVADGASEAEIRRVIRSQGSDSLSVEALQWVKQGVTTIEEALSLRWL